MVYDAGDNNAFWHYVSSDNTGAATIEFYFDNDSDFGSPDGPFTADYVNNTGAYARYAQYRVTPTAGSFRSITIEYTYLLSFVLREPEATGTSSLQNLVTFHSRDNSREHWEGGHKFYPRLQLVYSRSGRPGRAGEGLIDFGYIKYRAYTVPGAGYFPSQYYTYEGGMVFVERDPGWYATVLEKPPEFVTLTQAEGNNIRLAVTRYQIEEGSVHGESTGGTGYTSVRVQREEEETLVEMTSTPNRSEVTITIRTDHPRVWRDYLEWLAGKLNYQMGGEWDQYGDYVGGGYDYETVSLTIKGKDPDPDAQDIYYSERVIWLDTSLGYFHGGRT